MVEFASWQLPVHYGSLVNEHMAVRQAAGVFDVSHMTIVDITGEGAIDYLRRLLCSDVATLHNAGAALYSCMLNEQGGIIDDLIVYFLGKERYRIIVNAATRDSDLLWMNHQAGEYKVQITEQPQLAMVAVQGPQSVALVNSLLSNELASMSCKLNRYEACEADDWFVAATGYTGENGYEIALPESEVENFWQSLLESGVTPCGLGARDTLRLEAGMNLYGIDMDESNSPLTSGLGWTVGWQPKGRDFIGRAALEKERLEGPAKKMTGLVLDGKGVLRGGQLLYKDNHPVGVITSGTFSPTLKESIAFARVDADLIGDCEVQIRRNRLPVRQVKRIFVRHGQPVH